jgi:hypothetical protein
LWEFRYFLNFDDDQFFDIDSRSFDNCIRCLQSGGAVNEDRMYGKLNPYSVNSSQTWANFVFSVVGCKSISSRKSFIMVTIDSARYFISSPDCPTVYRNKQVSRTPQVHLRLVAHLNQFQQRQPRGERRIHERKWNAVAHRDEAPGGQDKRRHPLIGGGTEESKSGHSGRKQVAVVEQAPKTASAQHIDDDKDA